VIQTLLFSVFLTQKHDRQIKYDTTRPVSGKPSERKGSNQRKKSAGSRPVSEPVHTQPDLEENQEEVSVNNANQQLEEESDEEQQPIKVKMNTYKKRPQHVDKFCNELKEMEDMEQEFRKNTIALQKKLGIGETGMVI
jgi:hypothetical protein